MAMKKLLKKIIYNIFGVPYDWMKYYYQQCKRFYSCSSAGKDRRNMEYVKMRVQILTHEIDKGLSLPNPRMGFGKSKIEELVELVDTYIDAANLDSDVLCDAIEILREYTKNEKKYGLDVSKINLEKYDNVLLKMGTRLADRGGYVKQVDKLNFKEFAECRHSIRGFSTEMVELEDIEKAIAIARNSPSACNRQSARAIWIKNKNLVQQILEIQSGARGFQNVNSIILIGINLKSYWYAGESNTAFVDGGLFMMNLLYALKFYGIDTCPLIWDDIQEKRKAVDKILEIEKSLLIIGIVAIGKAGDDVKVTLSPRKEISNILKIVE